MGLDSSGGNPYPNGRDQVARATDVVTTHPPNPTLGSEAVAHELEQAPTPTSTDEAEAVVIDLRSSEPVVEIDQRLWLSPNEGLLQVPRWKLRMKRIIDIVGASVAIVVLAPVALLAAMAIKLTSNGPVLYLSKRVGQNGIPFEFYKFRSMKTDAHETRTEFLHLNEAQEGPIFKIRRDPRSTPIGRVLRKSSIDEIPQFINVLRGDMSLVGTRPPIPEEVDQYSDWEMQRLSIKPGITGIWQVSGRSEIPFDRWVEMDLTYICDWSLWLDFRIMLKTIPAVMSGKGAY